MNTTTLSAHRLKVVLVHPQIAPNTGNVARLCVATGTVLHLVRPMGFVLSDKQLRRSAMDYWTRLRLVIHDDIAAWQATLPGDARLWMFDSSGTTGLWQAHFQDGDWLVFGSETRGLNDNLLALNASRTVRIPQVEEERCLNLATSVGIALYELLRQIE